MIGVQSAVVHDSVFLQSAQIPPLGSEPLSGGTTKRGVLEVVDPVVVNQGGSRPGSPGPPGASSRCAAVGVGQGVSVKLPLTAHHPV